MFERWRTKHGGAAGKVASMTEELVAIGRGRGFIPGGESDKRTRQIGAKLHKAGGMDLVQQVHAAVADRVGKRSASRELDVAWDRIGDWLE
jgi:hypothetical protein